LASAATDEWFARAGRCGDFSESIRHIGSMMEWTHFDDEKAGYQG